MDTIIGELPTLKEMYQDMLGPYAGVANWVMAAFAFVAFGGKLVFGKTNLQLSFSQDQTQDILRASVFAGLLMFLGVTFWAENQTPAYDLGLIGMVLAASGVIAWGGFALIRSWLVFEVNTMDGRHHKGLWLTASAKDKLRGIGLPKGARKPPSAIELLSGNGNNLDAVWSANARRAAGAVLTLALFLRSSIVMAGVALFAVSLGPSSPAIKVISDTELELSAVALFSHDSSVLSEYGKKQLAQYLPQIVAQASTNIHVVGHTDTTGNKSYNLTLSLQRAQAVQAWMEARPELENVAIEAFGKGESEPLFDEETVGLLQRNEAQLGNRRVDILLDPMDEQSGK